MQNESLLDIFNSTVSFDECWKSDEIWTHSFLFLINVILFLLGLLYLALHVVEYLSSLYHFSTSYATINNWVESDDVGYTMTFDIFARFFNHNVVNFKSFVELVCPRVGFDHCCVDHCIRCNTNWVFTLAELVLSKDLVENFFSFVNVSVFDTSINQAAESYVVVQIFSIWILSLALGKHCECFIESTKLPVHFDEYAHLNGFVLRHVFCLNGFTLIVWRLLILTNVEIG